ncbi:hypothetical protein ACN08P_23355 (plasmid) [Photobacterium leiognathi subsp. mandapamensis]|uniref:hypothetical protein n=1 Tax=Photobacterium leiognathi TaxID=553611 RepID=UPI003AF40612
MSFNHQIITPENTQNAVEIFSMLDKFGLAIRASGISLTKEGKDNDGYFFNIVVLNGFDVKKVKALRAVTCLFKTSELLEEAVDAIKAYADNKGDLSVVRYGSDLPFDGLDTVEQYQAYCAYMHEFQRRYFLENMKMGFGMNEVTGEHVVHTVIMASDGSSYVIDAKVLSPVVSLAIFKSVEEGTENELVGIGSSSVVKAQVLDQDLVDIAKAKQVLH